MPPKAAPTPGSQSQLPKPQPSTAKLPELDKSKETLKDLHDSQKNDSMIHDDDAPSGNVREFILKHYGINAAEEKAKKEKRVGPLITPGREVPHVCAEHWPPGGLPACDLRVFIQKHPQRGGLQVRCQAIQRDREGVRRNRNLI